MDANYAKLHPPTLYLGKTLIGASVSVCVGGDWGCEISQDIILCVYLSEESINSESDWTEILSECGNAVLFFGLSLSFSRVGVLQTSAVQV